VFYFVEKKAVFAVKK